jgi:glycosyltransferase involved in cell wall biosynthesis
VIRVLHLAHIINRYDFIDNVLRHCNRERFQSYACTFTDQSNIENPVYADVPRYILGVKGRQSYPSALKKLVGILRRERIDIVHAHHFDPAVIGITAARLSGCTAIVGRHYSDSLYRLPGSWKRQLYLQTEALCCRFAARTIVPSAYIYDLLTRVQRMDERKVVRIPYGFDLAKYVPTPDGPSRIRQFFAPNGEILIGCFGRLHREKGQIYLLKAIKDVLPAFPRLRVVFIGEGSDRAVLENAIKEMGLADSAVLAGWRTDVVDFLSAVDIVVQPSISGEGFSQAMVEALALARPLIVTDVSGARDIVNHGETGLIVSPEDPRAIAQALRTLLTATQFARQLGEAGREYVRQELDIRRIVRRYEECYLAAHAESIAA